MIQITAQMRVLVAIEPVDGRKGIDSLARLCQEKLAEDPFSGCVFVFRSRIGKRRVSYLQRMCGWKRTMVFVFMPGRWRAVIQIW